MPTLCVDQSHEGHGYRFVVTTINVVRHSVRVIQCIKAGSHPVHRGIQIMSDGVNVRQTNMSTMIPRFRGQCGGLEGRQQGAVVCWGF